MGIALAGIEAPVRIASEELLSLDAFWEFSSENRDLRCERLPNGDIVVMTPTKRGTGSRSARILRALGEWADQDGHGEYFDSSTGFEMADGAVLSPDAAWTSFEALRAAEKDGEELPLCPQFVVELRSESDRLAAAQEKMRLWISYGVALAWLVDPLQKTVEIYRPGREVEVQEGCSAVEGDGPVAGFVLELGKIWG